VKYQIFRNISPLSLGRLAILCLVFVVFGRLISTIPLKLFEVKYELIDDFEGNESYEFEVYVDFESEEQPPLYTNFILPLLASGNGQDYSIPFKNMEDFSPNVLIPPPKV
jgi:hypothetical protein